MINPKIKKWAGYVLASIPYVGYSIYWTLHPSYWFNGDPAAFYFLDSLSVFAGQTYTYVDHPGTPIHIIGTIMLAFIRPFFGDTDAFIQFFIESPAAFFIMAHAFLLASCLFTAAVLYHTAYSTLKHYRLVGAMTLSFAYLVFHPQSFQSLTLWSHNSFNFPFGTLWLVWLYNELHKGTALRRNRLLLLGLAAGILAIAHIYFFTWIASGVLIIFLYSMFTNRRFKGSVSESLTFVLGTLAGIIIMLIPVYKELPRFAAWLTEITFHTGMYGTGEKGIFSLEVVMIAIRFWWTSIPLAMTLLMATIITSGLLVYRARQHSAKIPPAVSAMIIGLFFQTALLLILFTKAAVKIRYTLTIAAILPILLLLVIHIFEIVDIRKAKWAGIVYAVILVAITIIFPKQLNLALERSEYEEEVRVARSKTVAILAQELGKQEQEVTIVYAYGTPLKCANLLMASDYSGHFQKEISEMCPNQYGIYDTKIQLNPVQPLVDIREVPWDLVVWPGNGSDLPDYLNSVKAINIPSSWRVRRDAWYYIHAEAIK